MIDFSFPLADGDYEWHWATVEESFVLQVWKKTCNVHVDDVGQRSKWSFMIMQSLWFGEYDFFLSYERYVFFQWSHDTRVMNINIPSYSDIAFYL